MHQNRDPLYHTNWKSNGCGLECQGRGSSRVLTCAFVVGGKEVAATWVLADRAAGLGQAEGAAEPLGGHALSLTKGVLV